MISLDQILLLEQKVDSAVAKIAQLQAENAALRTRCDELTNALSSKSEQLTTFEKDSGKIESGIIKALDRLNSIENSILNAAGQALQAKTEVPVSAVQPVNTQITNPVQTQKTESENLSENQTTSSLNPHLSAFASNISFNQMNKIQPEEQESDLTEDSIEETFEEETEQTEQIQEDISIPVVEENSFQQPQNPEEPEMPEQTEEDGSFDIF